MRGRPSRAPTPTPAARSPIEKPLDPFWGGTALGLVVNAAVLWQTLYMNEALNVLQQREFQFSDEDVGRLSPLIYFNLNVLGRYSFRLSDSVARGELRPLRDSAA